MAFLCLALAAGISFTFPQKALACAPCVCVAINHQITRGVILVEHGFSFYATDPESLAYTQASVCVPGVGTRGWIGYQFCRHREEFIVFYFFKEHVLASMMMMTETLVSMAMEQMAIVGGFMDATQQLETQRLFQQLAAQAHKDYHPSHEMCEIGTLSRSLASAQRQGEYNTYFISQHMQDRQMRTVNMSSGAGKGHDIVNRWLDFKTTYCNPNDNDQKLGPRTQNAICDNTELEDRNADVDYTRMVEHPLTIDADYSNDVIGDDGKELLGLASNLYGHDVFAYFPEAFFKNPDNEDEFMYVRAIVAKRSVALNSFANIAGMKASGRNPTSAEVGPYMEAVLEQLGVDDPANRARLVHEFPSYYGQMEMLAKKLYQRPEFYTSLYDKPVNVERKRAAMRAIGLIQNMDLFKSKLRTEAALAVLTEMEIHKAQEDVQNKMSGARKTGLGLR